jgi:hypothetical protein
METGPFDLFHFSSPRVVLMAHGVSRDHLVGYSQRYLGTLLTHRLGSITIDENRLIQYGLLQLTFRMLSRGASREFDRSWTDVIGTYFTPSSCLPDYHYSRP